MNVKNQDHLCDHLHDDDGVPMREREPREYRGSRQRARFRKRAQLCTQTERSVLETLAAELDDLDLLDLTLHSVDPWPDADHFQITVHPNRDAQDVDFITLQARLDAFAPRVRAALARDISRKRTPFLSFLLLPREALI